LKIEKLSGRALITALFIASPVGLAIAQERVTEKPTQSVSTEANADKPNPAEKGGQLVGEREQQAEKAPLVPPAPLVVKTGSSTIAIPVDVVPSVNKYEERPVAMTNVIVGSRFGYRRDPFTRRSKFHSGLDIKARAGDPIAASYAGVVKFAGWFSGYGNWVVVDHGGGITTHYAHLSGFAVEAGLKVSRGTLIGYAGSTGRATSPHLHYEVRIDGNPVDPLEPIALDPESDYFKSSSMPATPATLENKPAVGVPVETAAPVVPAQNRTTRSESGNEIVKPVKKTGAKEKAQPLARTAARCVI
jgi:murein DD-endopeptidase MepM/ murein hydrolase activator NlpD